MQNMQFSSGKAHDELHTRTSDGLQVVLEISFQYQFLIEELHTLYQDYGEDGYLQVYFDVASHLIAEAATDYSAYQFFSSKEAIAIKVSSLGCMRSLPPLAIIFERLPTAPLR